MQNTYTQTRAISNARAAHTVDSTWHVRPVKLAATNLRVPRRTPVNPTEKIEAILLSCGFVSAIEFMEACKSNRLLTCSEAESQRVREAYAVLQEQGLLTMFWSMFRQYRAHGSAPVQDYTFVPPATWTAHNTKVILERSSRQIIVYNKLDLQRVKYVLNYSWEPVSKSSVDSQANLQRVLRIVANSGIRHAVEIAIMEGVQQ